MGDVIELRPKSRGWTDDLLSLPESPIKNCAKCGRGIHEEPHVWMSAKYGCGACAPEMEEPTTEISAWSSRASLLEAAIVHMYREVRGNHAVERVLKNLCLRVVDDRVESVVPPPPPEPSDNG